MTEPNSDNQTALTQALPTPYASAVLDFLAEEGFRPRLDAEGNVYFRYEAMTYVVVTCSDEPTALALVLHCFWPLQDVAERTRALEAAMDAQGRVRIGRITVLEDNVTASVNAYLPDESSFRAVLLRSLEGLKVLVLTFRDCMNAQLEN